MKIVRLIVSLPFYLVSLPFLLSGAIGVAVGGAFATAGLNIFPLSPVIWPNEKDD